MAIFNSKLFVYQRVILIAARDAIPILGNPQEKITKNHSRYSPSEVSVVAHQT